MLMLMLHRPPSGVNRVAGCFGQHPLVVHGLVVHGPIAADIISPKISAEMLRLADGLSRQLLPLHKPEDEATLCADVVCRLFIGPIQLKEGRRASVEQRVPFMELLASTDTAL